MLRSRRIDPSSAMNAARCLAVDLLTERVAGLSWRRAARIVVVVGVRLEEHDSRASLLPNSAMASLVSSRSGS